MFLCATSLYKMYPKFKIGDKVQYQRTVRCIEDVAAFDGKVVHDVYATFAIARDAEWTGRQFVLEMKEDNEEGIGTFVEIQHLSSALVGETVLFEATIDELEKNIINCSYIATVNERVIAKGRTGQKIIKKEKLNLYFESLKKK